MCVIKYLKKKKKIESTTLKDWKKKGYDTAQGTVLLIHVFTIKVHTSSLVIFIYANNKIPFSNLIYIQKLSQKKKLTLHPL